MNLKTMTTTEAISRGNHVPHSLMTYLTACVLFLLLTVISHAGITLNDGGMTDLQVLAKDFNGDQLKDIYPATLPINEDQTATMGNSFSQASFHLGQDGFRVQSSGVRDGWLDSRAEVQAWVYFSVSAPTDWSVSGSLSVTDPGLTGGGVRMVIQLLNNGIPMFSQTQGRDDQPNQYYIVGNGDYVGSQHGTLLPGNMYALNYWAFIYATSTGDPASFVGSFDFSVPTAVPEPSTYLAGISALGMLGLFWRSLKS